MNKRARSISSRAEAIEITTIFLAILSVSLVLPLLAKALPNSFIAQYDQWIMGPIVNCALIIVGLNFKGWSKTTATVLLPSIVHIANFYLFSIGTIYSLYLVPAIWLGNFALVLLVKFFHTHKNLNYFASSAIAIAVKVAIIFGIYSLFSAVNIIPQMPAAMLKTRMGINQLYVAAIGCLIAFAVFKLIYPNQNRQAHAAK